MAGKAFALSVIIRAIDKATAPLRAVGNAAKEASNGVNRFRSIVNTATPFRAIGSWAKDATDKFKRFRTAVNAIRIRWSEKLNISGISSSVKRIGDALGKVRSAITGIAKLGAVAATAATAYGGAIATIVKRTTDYGDAAVKTAQKIGMNVEAWQELAYAGKLAGADSEMFASMLAKLNKRIVEAAGGSEDAALWLNRAGVAFKDSSGKARSAEAVFMDLAEVFSQHEDGVKKTALAMGLFEEEGTKLIPLLNSGKTGLQAMRDEARQLGVVIDEKTARASENFNDNLTRLSETFFGFCNFLAAQLLPVFDEIVVSVRKWMLANSELIKSSILQWVNSFKAALPDLIKGLFAVADMVKNFFVAVSQNIDKIGGFTTALKLLAVVIGVILAGAVASAITAIFSLGAAIMATPIGWAIAGIALAVFNVYKAFKTWSNIREALSTLADLWMWPLRKLNEFIEYLTGINLFEIGKNIIGSLWDGFKAKWENVANWFGGLKNLIPVFNIQSAPVAQGGPQGAPRPSETPGATVTRQAAAAYAGGAQGRASRTETRSSAAVEVRFANLPKGTTVNTVENKGVDLKLNQGYAFVTP